ncbi:hypothetical protein FPOAC2_12857 [Fusarium poae]
MQFIDWVAHNISTTANDDLPLAKLQKIDVANREFDDTELPISIFHLPRLRVLDTYGLIFISQDNISIPEHGFAIEALYLVDSEIVGNGLWDIISGCKRLLVLSVHLSNQEPIFASKRAISNAILRQAGSLKELHLVFPTWCVNWLDEPQRVSNHEEIPLHRCFQRLQKLERLSVDVEDLRPSPEEQITPDFFGSALPLSLRELTINWKTGEPGSPAEIFFQRGELDVYLDVVNALKGLLVEVGAGHRNHLRFIYPEGVLGNSDQMDEVKECAKENGAVVQVWSFEDRDCIEPADSRDLYEARYRRSPALLTE